MSKLTRRGKVVIALTIVFSLFLVAGVGASVYLRSVGFWGSSDPGPEVEFEIPNGSGAEEIGKILEGRGRDQVCVRLPTRRVLRWGRGGDPGRQVHPADRVDREGSPGSPEGDRSRGREVRHGHLPRGVVAHRDGRDHGGGHPHLSSEVPQARDQREDPIRIPARRDRHARGAPVPLDLPGDREGQRTRRDREAARRVRETGRGPRLLEG